VTCRTWFIRTLIRSAALMLAASLTLAAPVIWAKPVPARAPAPVPASTPTPGSGLPKAAKGPGWSQPTRGEDHVWTADLGQAISAKQRSMIDSGFSTFTELVVMWRETPDGTETQLQQIACSVKFDTWEERYEILGLNGQGENTQTAREFPVLAEQCLTVRLDAATLPTSLRAGGVLTARMRVKQASPEEAARAKEWLVRQQTGVIQNLFSHMLGELSLSEIVTLRIPLTPPPKVSGQRFPGSDDAAQRLVDARPARQRKGQR